MSSQIPLPRTLVDGFATGQMWYRHGPLHVWTDGWYLFAPSLVGMGVPIKPTKKYGRLPLACVIAARGFDKIELLSSFQNKVIGIADRERADAIALACDAIHRTFFELNSTFKVKYRDMFSTNLLEHTLVDLDISMEAIANQKEVDEFAYPIQVTNYLLDFVQEAANK